MKLTLLVILTIVNSVFAADQFQLRYTCTQVDAEIEQNYNLFIKDIPANAAEGTRREVIFTQSNDYIVEFTNPQTHFFIQAQIEDLFITEANQLMAGEEVYGDLYLEFNEEQILKSIVKLPVERCAGDFTEETCLVEKEYQCTPKTEIPAVSVEVKPPQNI